MGSKSKWIGLIILLAVIGAAAIYLLLHLIADLLMGALDPRAKLEGMR